MKKFKTEFMEVFDHENNQIDLQHLPKSTFESTPTELHFKRDGSVSNEPSLTIVLKIPRYASFYTFGQMSLSTLSECLEKLGYEIKPKTDAR